MVILLDVMTSLLTASLLSKFMDEDEEVGYKFNGFLHNPGFTLRLD